jgi:hypothetical protein
VAFENSRYRYLTVSLRKKDSMVSCKEHGCRPTSHSGVRPSSMPSDTCLEGTNVCIGQAAPTLCPCPPCALQCTAQGYPAPSPHLQLPRRHVAHRRITTRRFVAFPQARLKGRADAQQARLARRGVQQERRLHELGAQRVACGGTRVAPQDWA